LLIFGFNRKGDSSCPSVGVINTFLKLWKRIRRASWFCSNNGAQ
jgi:hypothetical protein